MGREIQLVGEIASSVVDKKRRALLSTNRPSPSISLSVSRLSREPCLTFARRKALEELGLRARTIRALPLFLLCCDYFLSVDDREVFSSFCLFQSLDAVVYPPLAPILHFYVLA